MTRKARIVSKGSIYHVLSRGNNKESIFNQEEDKEFFQQKLLFAKQKYKFKLLCFAIMPNHFHLLIQPSEQASLSTIMKSLLVSYSFYYNHKNNRVGHVFQDRFKSYICLKDTYLVTLISYIHQNPKRAGLVNDSSEYKYSSLQTYLKKSKNNLVDKKFIIEFLENSFGQKGTVLIKKIS